MHYYTETEIRSIIESVVIQSRGAAIVAKAHIHMTALDAKKHDVKDGQKVCVKVLSARPVTLDDVVIRIKDTFSLAMHIDFDEANAMAATGDTKCVIC